VISWARGEAIVGGLKIAIGSSSMVSNLLLVGTYSAVSSAPVPREVELVVVGWECVSPAFQGERQRVTMHLFSPLS
jgi:hypothetical protein